MSKKYLSLEEAAARVGVETAELNRMREKGMIRAFADRGTWKFKEEDVENLARNREFDSDPDLSLAPDESRLGMPTGDSSGDLIFSDDDILGQQPTIISKGKSSDDSSDSDVRLLFEDMPTKAKGGQGKEAKSGDSDSDVKLAGSGSSGEINRGSDSDVRLVTDEAPRVKAGSDSDVRLVSSDSSSDMKIPQIDLSTDMPVVVRDDSGSSVLDDDGISLAGDSAAPLGGDSGISLERPNDSGISLSEESSIILSGDSGISLAPDDDGISVADTPVLKSTPPAKSPPAAKGKTPPAKAKPPIDDDDLGGTIPLLDNEDLLETDDAVPVLGGSSDEIDTGSSTGTSVITLDDDDDYATSGETRAMLEEAVDDEEVVDELIGEDDEIAEDVFGAEDTDFDDGLESGESSAEFAAPRMAAAVEQDWGTGTLVTLVASTVAMVLCGILMFDMVRNLWHTDVNSRNPIASMLLDLFKGM